jgi:DNA-binding transcriptional regulator YiaG
MTPEEIKELRHSLGLSQAEFLEQLGITGCNPDAARQTVSRWERGTRNPSGASEALLRQLAEKRLQ